MWIRYLDNFRTAAKETRNSRNVVSGENDMNLKEGEEMKIMKQYVLRKTDTTRSLILIEDEPTSLDHVMRRDKLEHLVTANALNVTRSRNMWKVMIANARG